MRRSLFSSLLISQVGQMLFLSHSAFPIPNGVDSNLATLRQENRAAAVKIAGTLSCSLGENNTGNGCTLQIRENASGRIYHLKEGNQATMRLFQDGARAASVEGVLIDPQTIQVKKTEAL